MYIQCSALWKYCSYALIPMALGTCRCEDLIDCSMQAGRHTIILMQPSQNRASRTFMDYNSINHALDGKYDFKKDLLLKIQMENLFNSVSPWWFSCYNTPV
jgi:hypothetical protein